MWADPDALKQHAPLVRRLAWQMCAKLPSNVEADDLIQAGMLGLNDALLRFDASHGAQFVTFATTRIRGAMMDYRRSQDTMSRGDRKAQRRAAEATRKLEQELGRPPIQFEIAAELGLSLTDYQAAAVGVRVVSLQDMAGTGDEYLDGHVAETHPGPDTILQEKQQREKVVEAIKHLPDQELYVMRMHYEQDMKLFEIGDVLGVSHGYVSQVLKKAIARCATFVRRADALK